MSRPPVPIFDLAMARTAAERPVRSILEEGWERGRARGAISYDPEGTETLDLPPLRFYHLPGREARPRAAPETGESLHLGRPHRPCPFDSPDFLEEREVLRIRHREAVYHLALNKFPVLPLHYLAVRPASEPPDRLPQRLTGPEEIEDLLRLAAILGPPYRLFFNSNRGGDGSNSGSSVNHWHFQIFPCVSEAVNRAPRIAVCSGEVEYGSLPDWPARHRLYRSADPRRLAAAVWAGVSKIDALDVAYNLELDPLADGRLVALFFPRAKVPDVLLPCGQVLPGEFGGIELSGGVVVSRRPLFDWIRAHPNEAVARVMERMAAGTRDPLD